MRNLAGEFRLTADRQNAANRLGVTIKISLLNGNTGESHAWTTDIVSPCSKHGVVHVGSAFSRSHRNDDAKWYMLLPIKQNMGAENSRLIARDIDESLVWI